VVRKESEMKELRRLEIENGRICYEGSALLLGVASRISI
jgi:hypothetical protein